jgi:hypothetical protein
MAATCRQSCSRQGRELPSSDALARSRARSFVTVYPRTTVNGSLGASSRCKPTPALTGRLTARRIGLLYCLAVN